MNSKELAKVKAEVDKALRDSLGASKAKRKPAKKEKACPAPS